MYWGRGLNQVPWSSFASAAAVYIAQIYNPGHAEGQSLRVQLFADLAFVLLVTVILASSFFMITTMLESTNLRTETILSLSTNRRVKAAR